MNNTIKEIDNSKIHFKSYTPMYQQYLDELNNDENVRKFVNFSNHNSRLIFYGDDFVGAYRVELSDEEDCFEIFIGLMQKYRGLGIANHVVSYLAEVYSKNNPGCRYAYLSIDKNNESSIKMANRCGFVEDENLERELRDNNDPNTLIFVKPNQYYVDKDNSKGMSI